MPGTTTRLALPYPLSTESPAGQTQIQNLANALDNAAIDLAEGTLAARPAPSIRGRWYYATDVATLYRDSGSTWRAVMGNDVVGSAQLAADSVGTSELAPLAVTNAEVAAGAAIAESKLALASDAAAGTASRRTLGSGATQACAGNDARLSDQRVPTDGSVTVAKLAAAVAEAIWKPGDIKAAAIAVTAGSEPSGWLLCDGRAVSRTTFAVLYAAFGGAGSPHGQGDGSTTFNLPDYRGRTLFGKGTHADVDAVGDSDGIALGSRRAGHAHTVNSHSHGGSTGAVGTHGHQIGNTGGSTGSVAAILYQGGGTSVSVATDGHGHTVPDANQNGAHSHSISGDTPGTDVQGPAYGVVNYLVKT